MSTDMRIEFTNAAEVNALLSGLPKQYQSKVMKAMIKDATKPLLDQARQNAPRSKRAHKARGHVIPSGTLSKSIGIIDIRKAKTVTQLIGPRVKGAFGGYKGGWYGHWVEFGHKIRRGKSGKFLETKRTIRLGRLTIFAGDRSTDTIAPKPFMKPAWDSKSGAVKTRFETDAVNIFNKYVNKMKSKGKL